MPIRLVAYAKSTGAAPDFPFVDAKSSIYGDVPEFDIKSGGGDFQYYVNGQQLTWNAELERWEGEAGPLVDNLRFGVYLYPPGNVSCQAYNQNDQPVGTQQCNPSTITIWEVENSSSLTDDEWNIIRDWWLWFGAFRSMRYGQFFDLRSGTSGLPLPASTTYPNYMEDQSPIIVNKYEGWENYVGTVARVDVFGSGDDFYLSNSVPLPRYLLRQNSIPSPFSGNGVGVHTFDTAGSLHEKSEDGTYTNLAHTYIFFYNPLTGVYTFHRWHSINNWDSSPSLTMYSRLPIIIALTGAGGAGGTVVGAGSGDVVGPYVAMAGGGGGSAVFCTLIPDQYRPTFGFLEVGCGGGWDHYPGTGVFGLSRRPLSGQPSALHYRGTSDSDAMYSVPIDISPYVSAGAGGRARVTSSVDTGFYYTCGGKGGTTLMLDSSPRYLKVLKTVNGGVGGNGARTRVDEDVGSRDWYTYAAGYESVNEPDVDGSGKGGSVDLYSVVSSPVSFANYGHTLEEPANEGGARGDLYIPSFSQHLYRTAGGGGGSSGYSSGPNTNKGAWGYGSLTVIKEDEHAYPRSGETGPAGCGGGGGMLLGLPLGRGFGYGGHGGPGQAKIWWVKQ